MVVVSHRGYHVDAPENTIEAFERALSMGVDGIETDVCLSTNGVPILFHDRLTSDGREVSAVSRTVLSDLVGYPVATLDDLERLIVRSAKHTLWNLEVKQPEALDATLALVNRQRGSAHFLITSFWHTVVLDAAKRTSVECGLLVCHRPLPFSGLPEWLGTNPNIRTMVWDYERVDSTLIADATGCGLRSFVYGAVTPSDHRQVAAWGVNGVITDRPELALSFSG
jgi:glycerophosphoryl diester phosphodiesterase